MCWEYLPRILPLFFFRENKSIVWNLQTNFLGGKLLTEYYSDCFRGKKCAKTLQILIPDSVFLVLPTHTQITIIETPLVIDFWK